MIKTSTVRDLRKELRGLPADTEIFLQIVAPDGTTTRQGISVSLCDPSEGKFLWAWPMAGTEPLPQPLRQTFDVISTDAELQAISVILQALRSQPRYVSGVDTDSAQRIVNYIRTRVEFAAAQGLTL